MNQKSRAASNISILPKGSPLDAVLLDPTVTEIMINGPDRIFVEQKGIVKKTSLRFSSLDELKKWVQELAQHSGRNLNAEHPSVAGRLPDGSRFHAMIAPAAVDGVALSIRKHQAASLKFEELPDLMDEATAFFLHSCVQAKINILITGSTGCGKTTLLNLLASQIPTHDRIVTVEDTAEIRLPHENWVRLEGAAHITGETARYLSLRQLVIESLRLRPDRLLVGEVRGAEAYDMLVAMNTGHEGCMSTLHANSARDAIKRLEVMMMMAVPELPLKAQRGIISSSLQLVIHMTRGNDGVRRVSELLEITPQMEGDVILVQDIMTYSADHGSRFKGLVPRFVQHQFRQKNVAFPTDFFTGQYKVRR